MENIAASVFVLTTFLFIKCLCEVEYAFVELRDGVQILQLVNYAVGITDTHVAKASFSNEINSTGWAYLEIKTAATYSDEEQAFSAGFLEGFLTRDLIWMHWQNMLEGYCYNKTDVCGLIEEYVTKNEEFIAKMIENYVGDPYWYQLKLYYLQIQGLSEGYNNATTDTYQMLTLRDILWINMLGDLDDLAFALSMPRETSDGVLFPDKCTGLVKLLPGLRELYTSQVTWNRIQKLYILNYRTHRGSLELIPGRKMSLSSYPGFVQSTDDFYVISSGLVAGETTIGNSNRSLFELISPHGQILEYARAMIANRLARDGKEWVDLFRRYNSGTYNNQWYIVDYNKFKAETKSSRGSVSEGLLWVVEQIPGYTEAADLTEKLLKETYFPSYNIPFFENVFNLSGGTTRVKVFGDWFGYHTNPRAKIIKEKQGGIRNLRDMFWVLRYNDYRNDPLARCAECRPPYSACNAIAARNDLNPQNGTYPFRALGHRSHGATDAKVTSASLRSSLLFVAVSGPTYNISRGIPPFSWSSFDLGPHITHVGHPDLWMFPPLVHHWEFT